MDNSLKHSTIVDCWGPESLSISSLGRSLALLLYSTFAVSVFCLVPAVMRWVGLLPDYYYDNPVSQGMETQHKNI